MARYKLEDIFDLQMGKTPSRNNSEYWNTCDNKWISIGDLTQAGKYITDTKEYLSDVAVEESGIKIIPANTVVMSFKLSIGKTAITSEDMYSNEAIMAFHDKHVVDLMPEYIYYMFKYKDWDEGTNKAVMGKTLNKATLSKVEIEVCPLEKQKEIVELLDKVSTVLDGRNEELKKLDELIKARFVEMFGDQESNPKGWDKCTVGDCCTLKSGTSLPADKENEGGPIPYVKVGDMNYPGNERYITTSSRFVSAETAGKGLFEIGSILFPKRGGAIGTNKKRMTILPVCADLNVMGVSSNGKHLPEFLLAYFDMIDLSSLSDGSSVPQINNKNIAPLEICVPPMDMQRDFAVFVAQVDKSKAVVQSIMDKLNTLQVSLMQEYFG